MRPPIDFLVRTRSSPCGFVGFAAPNESGPLPTNTPNLQVLVIRLPVSRSGIRMPPLVSKVFHLPLLLCSPRLATPSPLAGDSVRTTRQSRGATRKTLEGLWRATPPPNGTRHPLHEDSTSRSRERPCRRANDQQSPSPLILTDARIIGGSVTLLDSIPPKSWRCSRIWLAKGAQQCSDD